MDLWKPDTTVAAVIEREGLFLMIEESTREGVRLNQPAGHLDPGESLVQAVVREALEETAHQVEAIAGIGVYLSRYRYPPDRLDVTYLRFAFACRVLGQVEGLSLDAGIQRALWMPPEAIRARIAEHRSPLVMRVIDDYLAGQRLPLSVFFTHPECLERDR